MGELLCFDDFLKDGIMLTDEDSHSEESASYSIEEGIKMKSAHF